MTQATRVFVGLDADRSAAVRSALEAGLPLAEWRKVAHARFSMKADGVVVTCYESGKLLVQGRDPDGFVASHLAALVGEPTDRTEEALPLTGVTLGSDETGKGDYFGPLVVAAACVAPAQLDRLLAAGVTDSKKLSDTRARTLAGLLEAELPHEFSVLPPPLYNEAYGRARSVNVLLADMHARALSRLLARCPDASAIVVDQFGHERLVADALARQAVGHPPLVQTHRGERHPAVAAASILARARFLDDLAACSEACGTELAKGAGTPVDVAAREVVAIGGRALLATVAKLHFRNTDKIPGG